MGPQCAEKPIRIELRELLTTEEIRAYFHVRYQVYTHNGFISPNPEQLDIDRFDPYCRFVGAFLEERMVGGIRMILPDPQAPQREAVHALASSPIPERPYPYYSQGTFDLDPLMDLSRQKGLQLVEFGRTVCLPECRGQGVGLSLVHAIHGLAVNYGVEVGLASVPPHLREFYEKFGCQIVEQKGVKKFKGLNTLVWAVVVDLRKLSGPFRMAYEAAGQLRTAGRVRLCSDRDCLLLHDHRAPARLVPVSAVVDRVLEESARDRYRRVILHDETLRDGLQSPSVRTPDLDGKLEILHRMAELGIESANLGLPGAGPRFSAECLRLVRELEMQGLELSPTLAGRTTDADIDAILEICEQAGRPVEAGLFLGSSALRQVCERWSVDHLLRLADRAITRAVKGGLPVMFVTEDTVRAHPDTLARLYRTALRCGARALCLCDTAGHATPDGVHRLVGFVRSVVEDTGASVRLDWHGHRDRGLAVANTLAAIEAGVDRVHGTALGIGERCGNTPLEHLLTHLEERGRRAVDRERLQGYLETVSRACQVPVPAPLRKREEVKA